MKRTLTYATVCSGIECWREAPNTDGLYKVSNFGRVARVLMAEYEHTKPPKPKSANQVRAWLEKISNAETCPDSPRYKACGNGWATNQPRWITMRILAIGEGIDPFTGEELNEKKN